jgi:hypothetical protein
MIVALADGGVRAGEVLATGRHGEGRKGSRGKLVHME